MPAPGFLPLLELLPLWPYVVAGMVCVLACALWAGAAGGGPP